MGKHYGAEGKVVLFKKFDERKVVYEGELGVQEVRDFITENSLPTLIEFNHDNAQKMFKRQGVLFTSVDVGEEDHRRMVEFLGVRHRINNDTFPTMRIVTMRDSGPPVRFKPAYTTVSEENVRDFVTKYIAGEVPRDYFTEPLPEDWDAAPAKYLTAANFESMVLKTPSRPSLVMWFAPWCGHCKNIMGVWDQLGEKFPDHLVAKIDATVNEVPGLPHVHTFPTIKLYRTDGTEAEYNGERTVEGISKFLTTDGVFGLAAPDSEPSAPVKDEL